VTFDQVIQNLLEVVVEDLYSRLPLGLSSHVEENSQNSVLMDEVKRLYCVLVVVDQLLQMQRRWAVFDEVKWEKALVH
jgi:hypothetical protein